MVCGHTKTNSIAWLVPFVCTRQNEIESWRRRQSFDSSALHNDQLAIKSDTMVMIPVSLSLTSKITKCTFFLLRVQKTQLFWDFCRRRFFLTRKKHIKALNTFVKWDLRAFKWMLTITWGKKIFKSLSLNCQRIEIGTDGCWKKSLKILV